MKGRLMSHRCEKADHWTHFSIYEVWDNISAEEIEELEGLFRHIHRRDSTANALNKQRSFRPLERIRRKDEGDWL